MKQTTSKLSFKFLRKEEHLQLWGLFWLTVAVIYGLPKFIDYFFVLGLLVLFSKTKKDYFWLAYFVLLNYAPFGFFSEHSADAAFRLPLFRIAPGAAFSTEQLFLFIALGKAIYRKNKVYSFFTKHYKVLLLYLVLLLVIAFLVHQASAETLIDKIKKGVFILFPFVLYKLLTKREDQYKFIFLLLPFGFLIVFDAIYFLASGGQYVYNIFNPHNVMKVSILGIEGGEHFNIRYKVNGFILSLIIFYFSLSYNFLQKNKNYFLTLAIAAFLAILIGALRSWFVIYSIAILFFINYSSGKIKNMLAAGAIFLLLLLPVFQVSTGNSAFMGVIERVGTIFTIGEESSDATQSIEYKYTNRLPSQLNYIARNPITGWGYTDVKGDGDVGNFGLLVDVGFVGFFIFLWFWIAYIQVLRKNIKMIKSKNARSALKMLIVLFLGVLLSHFTTNKMFGIYGGIFIGMLIFITEFIIQEAKIYDYKARHANK